MGEFRLEYHIPDIYVSESRDFQLLCRLFDSVHNGVRFDINGIEFASNPKIVRTVLLQLLAGKVGYFPKTTVDGRLLRYVVAAFPYLLKNKGTQEGIRAAIQVFLKGMQINKQVGVKIINRDEIINNSGNAEIVDKYVIQIELSLDNKHLSILNDILSYVIPTGYIIEYVDTIDFRSTSNVKTSDSIKIMYINNTTNSQVKGSNTVVNMYTCDGIDVLDPSSDKFDSKVFNLVSTENDTEVMSAAEVVLDNEEHISPILEVVSDE